MAAPNKQIFPLGLNNARIYKLNSSGYIDATSHTTPYYGLVIGGPTILTLDVPERTTVVHPGHDRALQFDSTSPLDPVTGSLAVSRIDYDTIVASTGTKVRTEGDFNIIGAVTDTEQASQPQFAMMIYRQAKDKGGVRIWNGREFPILSMSPRMSGFQSDRQDPVIYTLNLSVATANIAGEAFTTATDGYKTAVWNDIEGYNRPVYCGFLANGSATEFNFDADKQAASTSNITVWVNKVKQTSGITYATDGVTFAVAPAASANITIRYGLAADANDFE